MQEQVETRFAALEERRRAFADRVRDLDEVARNQKPASGGFSPIEVVEHIALMEGHNVGYLDRTAPASLAGGKTKLRLMGKYVMKALQSPNKYMAGTHPAAVPKGEVDLESAAKKWEETRERLKSHLDGVSDADAPFIKMDWIFGTLSANQYFELMEGHVAYHEHQFPV